MIQLELSNKTELLLKQMLSFHSNQEIFFQSVINNEINHLNRGIRNIEKDLIEYEKKYLISTEYFYQKFSNGEYGEYGDDDDFMIWAGIYEMLLRSKQNFKKLEW